ncbi:hypothetical protein PVAP13_5NG141562 [Panicum virgatum]|uniref:Uncharacterized protein n=1 Tax=Panicum virgatum TaxID=38727 RepID=A0A8T0RPH0_PANVG|nr:hypothetical protein PVAP13_5NG141562 [Panicum virgatum]
MAPGTAHRWCRATRRGRRVWAEPPLEVGERKGGGGIGRSRAEGERKEAGKIFQCTTEEQKQRKAKKVRKKPSRRIRSEKSLLTESVGSDMRHRMADRTDDIKG